MRGRRSHDYWGQKIARALNLDADALGADTILNLASREYFRAVDLNVLKIPVITCHFKEMRGGKPSIISFRAKRARGLMARYLVTNAVTTVDNLKQFSVENYAFAPELSDRTDLVFLKQS